MKAISNKEIILTIQEKETEIQLLKDKQEKIRKRKNFNQSNTLFELNRLAFYRGLEDENEEFTELNAEQKKEFYMFWKEIWEKESPSRFEEILDTINGDNSDNTIQNVSFSLERERFDQLIKKLGNWKAPGVDIIHAFWIKKLSSLHELLFPRIKQAIENPQTIPTELFEG